MSKNSNEFFDKLISKTKIYLVIIAILFLILFVYDVKFIIPGVLIYALIIAYTFWADKRRTAEISNHVQELLITMDSTAKKTLINSPLPLIIAETDGNIIWKSSKFVNEFADIDIKNYIDDLIKEIKSDIERENNISNNIVKAVEIGNSNYRVLGEYVKSKNSNKKQKNKYMIILYFIDETEKLKTEKKYMDESQCVGIVTVDNYEEIIQRIPNEDRPQIIVEIEKILYKWASEVNGLMVKNERNSFIFVFEYKYLSKMKENKFEILDTIKDIDIEGKLQLTLSISISYDGSTNYEKYESALAGMDIVLGRGGDQAVIKEDGKYSFFGGKAQEMEKMTKIKARMFAKALEELIQNSSNVLIMGHKNGDMDSIGSALGIYRLAKSLGKDAYVINNTYGLSLKRFLESLEEDDEQYRDNIINKTEALNKVDSESVIIVVDTHKIDFVEVPELLNKTDKIVVIDHHRRSTNYIENVLLSFQEVYASSAAELVTEILQYTEKDVKLRNIETEALYAGIMMDTKNFTFKTGVRTFEAAAYLRKGGVDIIRVKKWFESDFETYKVVSEIVKDSEIIRDSIAISIFEGENANNVMAAKAADELLTIANITASFVLGKVGDRISISGRSIGDINVQLILEKLGGGGHITIAGVQLENITLEDAKKELIDKIDEYFEENM